MSRLAPAALASSLALGPAWRVAAAAPASPEEPQLPPTSPKVPQEPPVLRGMAAPGRPACTPALALSCAAPAGWRSTSPSTAAAATAGVAPRLSARPSPAGRAARGTGSVATGEAPSKTKPIAAASISAGARGSTTGTPAGTNKASADASGGGGRSGGGGGASP
eukprot:127362-Chlamydomonas_euryale.AAC.8